MIFNEFDNPFLEISQTQSNKNPFRLDFDLKNNEQEIIESTKETKPYTNALNKDLNQESNKLNNFNFIKPKIFNIHKVQRRFKLQRLGRPRKKEKRKKCLKKGKYRKGNASPKIFKASIRSAHNYVLSEIPNLSLDQPTITDDANKSNEYWRKVADMTLYDLYCDSLPKRIKGDTKIKTEDKLLRKTLRKEIYAKNNRNKNTLDFLLGNQENPQYQKYYIIFKVLHVKDFIKPYLNNTNKIVKYHEQYGIIDITLNGFETYSQHFNFEYDKRQKAEFKQHVLDIIYRRTKDRIFEIINNRKNN